MATNSSASDDHPLFRVPDALDKLCDEVKCQPDLKADLEEEVRDWLERCKMKRIKVFKSLISAKKVGEEMGISNISPPKRYDWAVKKIETVSSWLDSPVFVEKMLGVRKLVDGGKEQTLGEATGLLEEPKPLKLERHGDLVKAKDLEREKGDQNTVGTIIYRLRSCKRCATMDKVCSAFGMLKCGQCMRDHAKCEEQNNSQRPKATPVPSPKTTKHPRKVKSTIKERPNLSIESEDEERVAKKAKKGKGGKTVREIIRELRAVAVEFSLLLAKEQRLIAELEDMWIR
ncbi:hypothetical protein BU17DRAFT_68446 [Hysterangium stoloniferum]|nr:hypothetical protein BU17DRAFT_68446 [Hysterangium stoloniferum]